MDGEAIAGYQQDSANRYRIGTVQPDRTFVFQAIF